MSVLVVCKNLRHTVPEASVQPIATLARPESYRDALEHWGACESDTWLAVHSWDGAPWGELVNEAVKSDAGRIRLVGALGTLARNCAELAIWYAGFPDDVSTAKSASEFEALLAAQLEQDELEPAVRMLEKSAATGAGAADRS